jgi:cytoskeleton protein RodZ
MNDTNSGLILIGDYLKAKREEMHLSIEKISQRTKININILKVLEKNDLHNLPSAAYIKGFVLSYAKVVNLSSEDVINKLEYSYLTIMGKPFPQLNHTKNFGISQPKETKIEEDQSPQSVLEASEKMRDTKKLIIPISVFAGITLTFIGLYTIITSAINSEADHNSVGSSSIIESSSALVDVSKMNSPHTEAQKINSGDSDKEKTDKPETVANANKETGPIEATPAPVIIKQRNYPTVEFRKITKPLFSELTEAPENNDSSLFPSEIKNKINKDLENVYIKAVDGNSWLSYKVGTQPIQSTILEKGKDLYLQGETILIYLGNVAATKIFYNNFLIDAPTKTGTKSLVFPASKNSNYVLPLFPKANDDILFLAEEYQKRMKLEEEEFAKMSGAKP